MEQVKRIPLKCPHCGTLYNYKAPANPGSYSIGCINKECGKKFKFNYGVRPKPEPKPQEKPKPQVQPGWQEDGSFVIKCDSEGCGQLIRKGADLIKVGKNPVKCPRCGKLHVFEKEPSQEEQEKAWLKCKEIDCEGVIERPEGENGVFETECKACGTQYLVVIENGKIIKVSKKTLPPPSADKKMKLVTGNFMGKKEYELRQGTHYIGRYDEEAQSDFPIKDKYASKRSIRIDAIFDKGNNLVYKMTVERALNPVYHNNREMAVGDIDYLNYGDTLKLGKTLIKVQKIEKPKR